MIDALIDLPPHLRDRLASAFETGLVGAPYSVGALRSALGAVDVGERLLLAVQEMERLGLAGASAAALVRTVGEVTRRTTKPDIVWSG